MVGTSLALLGFMTKLESYLEQGCTLLLTQEWHAREALRLVAKHHLSTIGGIPTQMALMLRLPDFGDYDLSAVKRIVLGGARPLRPSSDKPANAWGCRCSCGTRAPRRASGSGRRKLTHPKTPRSAWAGLARVWSSPSATSSSGGSPTGRRARCASKSDASMLYYYRNPEATAEVFTDDGAVRTGDIGWVDDKGRLRLAGRSKDMYIRGGYNVFPNEVERVLVDHPSVAEVSVVPRPDDVDGGDRGGRGGGPPGGPAPDLGRPTRLRPGPSGQAQAS